MLKIGLVGAVETTAWALDALAGCGHAPVILITLPIEKSARHSDFVDLGPSASALGIPIVRAANTNEPELIERLSELNLDILFVIGWSRLCAPDFLALPKIGTLGYHPTLLPKMRGRAALAWTLLLDVRRTASTIFWMDEGMDSGDIAAQQPFPLTGTETLQQLFDLHETAVRSMIPPLFEALAAGRRPAQPQDHSQATYVALRRPADGEIDWTLPASKIERLIRAVSRPYPGAFTSLGGSILRIWSARLVSYPQWEALTGQVFTYEGSAPVVRCGDGTDLALLDFQIEPTDGPALELPRLLGQPRLGQKR